MYARQRFLTAGECADLCAEMDRAPRIDGGVREPDRPEANHVDLAGRRASGCEVTDDTLHSFGERICALAPQLGAHFGEALGQYESPHFVMYERGGFYRPHRDLYRDVAVPEPLARRRLSIVVFLNESDGDDETEPTSGDGPRRYAGGVLRVGSHNTDEFEPDAAQAVRAKRGMLVAFRADAWHEVTPITAGRRYSIVTLLLAPEGT